MYFEKYFCSLWQVIKINNFLRILGFPLSQNFRKFRAEVKWNGPFRFGPTGIFVTTSGGGLL